jgi:hypothetical protein
VVERASAPAGGICNEEGELEPMDEDLSELHEPPLRFPGPFEHHDVVVEGRQVPFLRATPLDAGQIDLTLDRRLGLVLSSAEAGRFIPFLADAIAVALGYTSHPDAERDGPHATAAQTRHTLRCPSPTNGLFCSTSRISASSSRSLGFGSGGQGRLGAHLGARSSLSARAQRCSRLWLTRRQEGSPRRQNGPERMLGVAPPGRRPARLGYRSRSNSRRNPSKVRR